jgi:colanic acid biosynthesis glycosyl transferase WcaI
VVDGCGVLVPAEDPAALGAALRALVDDAAGRQRLGAAGRARVARDFGDDAMLAGLERAYEAAA